LGTIVVQTSYRRFDPVGQTDECESCSSACKTTCAHLLPAESDRGWSFENFRIIDDDIGPDEK